GPVVLGGHSLGGMTVMAYAGLRPEAFAERVRGVVLLSTSAGDLARGHSRAEQAFMSLVARVPELRAGRVITLRRQRRRLFGEVADPAQVPLTRTQMAATTLVTIGRVYEALLRHDEAAALAAWADVSTVILVGD